MVKYLIALCSIAALCSVSFAQGRGGQGPGQGNQSRNQTVSIPVSVLRSSLPLDKAKLDTLEEDAKLFQMANLPLEALVELKLTAEQKKSITTATLDSVAKMREMMRNGDREGAMAAREQVVQKVSSLLTEEQKKTVAKYPAQRMGGNRGQFGPGQGEGRRGKPPVN